MFVPGIWLRLGLPYGRGARGEGGWGERSISGILDGWTSNHSSCGGGSLGFFLASLWVCGWEAPWIDGVQQPPPPPPPWGTLLGPWVFQKSGWVGISNHPVLPLPCPVIKQDSGLHCDLAIRETAMFHSGRIQAIPSMDSGAHTADKGENPTKRVPEIFTKDFDRCGWSQHHKDNRF